MEQIVIESCHSTWIIDMENSRFRRVVKGSDHRSSPASTEWQACYGVEIDPLSESFVVLLNPEGTRLLAQLAPRRALLPMRRRGDLGVVPAGPPFRRPRLSRSRRSVWTRHLSLAGGSMQAGSHALHDRLYPVAVGGSSACGRLGDPSRTSRGFPLLR